MLLNMLDQVIKNHQAIICGPPWSWKTLFAIWLAVNDYFVYWGPIYANFSIYRKYWKTEKEITTYIKSIADIEKLKFNPKKWVVIIDEAWLNNNSRRSSSNKNLEMAKLSMLWRKLNVDIISIAQLDYSIDKYNRDLAKCIFHMYSYFYKKNYLKFIVTVCEYSNWNQRILTKVEHDLFRWMEDAWYKYNTKQTSLLEK